MAIILLSLILLNVTFFVNFKVTRLQSLPENISTQLQSLTGNITTRLQALPGDSTTRLHYVSEDITTDPQYSPKDIATRLQSSPRKITPQLHTSSDIITTHLQSSQENITSRPQSSTETINTLGNVLRRELLFSDHHNLESSDVYHINNDHNYKERKTIPLSASSNASKKDTNELQLRVEDAKIQMNASVEKGKKYKRSDMLFMSGPRFDEKFEKIVSGHQQITNKLYRLARDGYKRDHQSYHNVTEAFSSLMSNVSTDHNNKLTSKLVTDCNYEVCLCHNTTCDCSSRDLTCIPQGLDTFITVLLLNSNSIGALPNNVLYRYSLLEHLDLHSDGIFLIEEGSFNGLAHLTYLDLSDNTFMTYADIHVLSFQPLMSLRILRINQGHLNCKPTSDAAFSHLHNLEELYITNYIIPERKEGFGPGFSNLTLLRHMNIQCQLASDGCRILSLWNTTFKYLGQITSLDITNCNINGRYIEREAFFHLRNLQTLDISQNRDIGTEYLPVILTGLRNSELQTLKMNYIISEHSLTFINSSIVQLLPHNLTTLVARGNNILSIEPSAVKSLPKTLRTVDISENYIFTDPATLPWNELNELETLKIQNKHLNCFTNDKFYSSDSDIAIIPKGQHTDNVRHSVLNQWILKTKLPWSMKRVQITVDDMDTDFILNLDKDNNIQEMDLSCSYIYEFKTEYLKNLPNLRYLNVGRSSVQIFGTLPNHMTSSLNTLILESNLLNDFLTVAVAPFTGFYNLSYLDLSKNQLNYVDDILFLGLNKLEYLGLNDNPFSHLDVDISDIGQVKIFNLSNTGLSYLNSDIRSHIDQLCKDMPGQIIIDMTNCPIQCDCFNLDFLKWMLNSEAFDKNYKGYKCKYPDTSSKLILDGYQETILVLDRECVKNYPMFLIVLAATLIILCAVMGAIIYRLRWKIRYLYYAAYLKLTDKHKNDNNHEFTYDVFISYDSEDQVFVTRSLSPELENRGLKLLIHTRDFVAGTYITSNIVMAVTESRKTLVVLTRNLVESTWCNYELQMATMEAVHTGRQVLVFLLKENIPSRELDVELLGHIRSNTYLPYPTPEDAEDENAMIRFYDKLAHDLRC